MQIGIYILKEYLNVLGPHTHSRKRVQASLRVRQLLARKYEHNLQFPRVRLKEKAEPGPQIHLDFAVQMRYILSIYPVKTRLLPINSIRGKEQDEVPLKQKKQGEKLEMVSDEASYIQQRARGAYIATICHST